MHKALSYAGHYSTYTFSIHYSIQFESCLDILFDHKVVTVTIDKLASSINKIASQNG